MTAPAHTDWADLAGRLDAVADDLAKAAPRAPGELGDEMVTLWSRTLQHYAIQLRQFDDV